MVSAQGNQGEGAFILGVLLGGVIGAAIGAWHSPRSGAETRQALRSGVVDTVNKLQRAILGERPADALAEGKAIARQRQIELSLNN